MRQISINPTNKSQNEDCSVENNVTQENNVNNQSDSNNLAPGYGSATSEQYLANMGIVFVSSTSKSGSDKVDASSSTASTQALSSISGEADVNECSNLPSLGEPTRIDDDKITSKKLDFGVNYLKV